MLKPKIRYTLLTEAQNYADRDAYISDMALSSIWGDGAEIPQERLELIHQYLVVSTPSLFQRSGIRALQTTPDAFVAACRRRRDFVLQSLAEMGLPVTRPEGAFYVFPDVSAFGLSSADFCRRMIVEVGLAATPGFCFGSDHHIRLSVCASDADLQEGMHRLRRFLERLREEKKGE